MTSRCSALLAALVPALALARPAQDAPVGYDDTPLLPGERWHVHDGARPAPRVVRPGEGSAAPADALVLFDGADLSAFAGEGGAARWRVADGCFEVVAGAGAIRTREEFADLQLHIEWAAPAEVVGSSQGRGNSGIFLMGRYEVQILDSFENRTYADGQAAALYGQAPPLVNASRAPGEWQCYDVFFSAPRFDGERLLAPARATVVHNGVLVHHARELLGATTHRRVATYAPHPATGPIVLQDHGNPVRFRNIWVRRIGAYDEG